jgi:hypothetical protein
VRDHTAGRVMCDCVTGETIKVWVGVTPSGQYPYLATARCRLSSDYDYRVRVLSRPPQRQIQRDTPGGHIGIFRPYTYHRPTLCNPQTNPHSWHSAAGTCGVLATRYAIEITVPIASDVSPPQGHSRCVPNGKSWSDIVSVIIC